MADYDVYAPDELPWELREEVVPETTGIDSWCVLVEAADAPQVSPPTRVVLVGEGFGEQADAVAAARQQAFDFQPREPAVPRLRRVFEDGAGFLTIVDGATSSSHFRTRVMRLVGVV